MNRICTQLMRMNAASNPRTKPTNVSLDAALVEEAKSLGVNISKASNRGLEEAVRKVRAERWLEENMAALEASNEWLAANGLPLEKYRLF
jgi:antitoxin CcdA